MNPHGWHDWSSDDYPRIGGEHAYYAVNGWNLSPVRDGIPGRGPRTIRDDEHGRQVDAHQRAWIMHDALARMLRRFPGEPETEDRWHDERAAILAAIVRQERTGNGGSFEPFERPPSRRRAHYCPPAPRTLRRYHPAA